MKFVQCQAQGTTLGCSAVQLHASGSIKVVTIAKSGEAGGISGARTLPSHLIPGQAPGIHQEVLDLLQSSHLYQKVQGGCIISYVGMLVTLTGMEMTAHGSPCCSRERRIMYLEGEGNDMYV